ncbi:hypothetical protein P3W45_000064 [Vairimorpha bombi]|jgi:hypothetical protein
MTNRANTSLNIFISDLRNTSKDDFITRILIEKRRLLNTSDISYTKVLTMIYFILQDIHVDPLDFVKACGSEDINIKKAAYLGLTLCKSNNLLILTVNTLMNDLKSLETRESALNFLCNINLSERIYEDLGNYICISSNMDRNITKSVIAKDRLCNLRALNVVGNPDSLVYVKLQLILDKMNHIDNFTLIDNDVMFLVSIYPTVKCTYLKVKLIQFYRKLYDIKRLEVKPTFYAEIESDVISPSESVKPTVMIALSVEVTELFLLTSQTTTKIEHFLYRLIDSNNPNSRFIGFRLAKKYGKLIDKVIDRSIKLGLQISYCKNSLLELLNKNNFKEIYKRKEEIRFSMDKNNIGYDKSKETLFEVFLKMLNYGNDEFIKTVYFENPELSFKHDITNRISETSKMELFTKLVTKQNVQYFHLIYCLMPTNMKNKEFYEEIFCSHLDTILKKSYPVKSQVIDKLIFTFCKFKDLTFFRDILKDKYIDMYNMKGSYDILHTLLNGIYLMNTKSKTKVVKVFEDKFLTYKVIDKNLRIMNDPDIKVHGIITERGHHLKYRLDGDEKEIICEVTNRHKLIVKVNLYIGIVSQTIYLN